MSLADEKRRLRRQMKEALEVMRAGERREWSARIQRHLLEMDEFLSADTVCFYDADATEPETAVVAAAALEAGKHIAFPRTDLPQRIIHIVEVRDLENDLRPSRFSFREPRKGLPEMALAELDLLVVPGRAFDERGNRLGRGGGCYDMLLSNKGLRATAAALAFELQLAAAVPVEAQDCPVDVLVTEKRIVRPHRK